MAKKVQQNNTPAAVSQKTTTAAPLEIPAFFLKTKLNGWLFFVVAFLLFSNSFTHDFVLDDSMLIYKNRLTTQGFAGIPGIFSSDVSLQATAEQNSEDVVSGGRYRPFSVAMFAVIYQFFGAHPLPFHLVSVLLFALTCLVLYRTLRLIFEENNKKSLLIWLATALFVVHPIHTEVVNNVKSCDEILALLFSLLALNFSIKAFRRESFGWMAGAFLAFLAACFTKENAVVFAVLIPLTLWMDTKKADSPNAKIGFGKIIKYTWPLWISLGIFLIVRGAVVGWTVSAPKLNLINNAFVKIDQGKWVFFTAAEKWATIIFTLGKYLLLHVFPHPLSHDYYPRAIAIQNFSSPAVLASLAANVFLFFYGVVGFLRGKMTAVRYGIFWYFFTLFLVSNIPVSIGTNMAERFVFMPSVGACLALASLLVVGISLKPAWMKYFLTFFGIVCLLFVGKTFSRNGDYANNKRLVMTDIKVAANSAKIQNALGNILLKESMNETNDFKKQAILYDAIQKLDRAIEIYPTYSEAFFARGSANFLLKKTRDALADFEKSLTYTPGRPEVLNNYAVALLQAAKETIAKKDNPALALAYLERGELIAPNNSEMMMTKAVAQIQAGNRPEAILILNKILILDPENQQVRKILAEITK